MDPFTMNMTLMDSLDSRKKQSKDLMEEDLPKEVLQKLKLIEKAFK
jgi:hypothetical protein